MFRLAAVYAFSPHPERRGLHLAPHQFDDLLFFEAVCVFDGFEWCSVLPRHFDDSRDVRVRELCLGHMQNRLQSRVLLYVDTLLLDQDCCRCPPNACRNLIFRTISFETNSMSQFESLLNAIPKDPKVAFILADYLEEHGDPRCELLRLSYTLKDMIETTPNRLAMEERMRELILVEGLEPVVPTYTDEIGMDFVWIPPGKFLMGSPADEVGREDDETQHQVELTQGFWMARTPVTQLQWRQLMDHEPKHYAPEYTQGDERPSQGHNWFECQEFCEKLWSLTGRWTFLPTETQWEYACRAGTTTPFWFGNKLTKEHANIGGEGLSEVKAYPPNSWGLYQMHGDVEEWCEDRYADYSTNNQVDPLGPPNSPELRRRVLRGGPESFGTEGTRSAARRRSKPLKVRGGFRCVQISE